MANGVAPFTTSSTSLDESKLSRGGSARARSSSTHASGSSPFSYRHDAQILESGWLGPSKYLEHSRHGPSEGLLMDHFVPDNVVCVPASL